MEHVSTRFNRMSITQLVGLVVGLTCMGSSYFIPATPDLSHEAIMSLGIMAGTVVMWFCGTMSTGVVGLIGVVALYLLGVQPTFQESFSGFTQTTTWFILGVFCMTALMQKSTLGIRLTKRFILLAGADSKKLVLAIMSVTALCSSVMSDTGAVALAMSFILPLLALLGAKKGESNLGKCLLMGASFGALLGGFTTPIGHSINVLALGLLEQQAGIVVNWGVWLAFGIPVALMVLPIAWYGLVRAFPPEDITQESIDSLMANQFKTGKMTTHDIKSLVLLIAIPSMWILGNWIPWLNATTVALVGMFLLFAPGIKILTWKEYECMVSWNLFLFFGTVLSLGGAIIATGAADYIATVFIESGILTLPVLPALFLMGLSLYVLQSFVPISLTWVTIFLLPLVVYAEAVGIPIIAPVFLMSCLAAGSYFLPLAPTNNVSYDAGFYSFGDNVKGGLFASVAIVVVASLWVYFLASIVGFGW